MSLEYTKIFRFSGVIYFNLDAWDVEVTALEKWWKPKSENYKFSLKSQKDTHTSFELVVKLSDKSALTQLITIQEDTKLIDFQTQVDWNESHKLLKVHFPVEINADNATYDIQHGYVQRPTHRNTSWDVAKFECLGHKFVDISEFDYGVSLFSDCKYGYSCLFKDLAISLLRSPKGPDANCDMCIHDFKYAFYPHLQDSSNAQVIKKAYEFNHPCTVLPGSWKSNINPIISLENPSQNVILDTIKIGERNQKHIILRLFESCGGHGTVKIVPNIKIEKAYLSNVLEDLLEVTDLQLKLHPFEVKTIILKIN
eukprot:NODE_14_length_51535_cov_1.125049.p23 type:complete len:311 gc:universal NODE_14_length_51535_cov_1.125049:42924-41992(-)